MREEQVVYRAALKAVSDYAGLQPETLLCRQHPPRWVGAMRWVLYRLLTEHGLSRSAVSRLTNKGFRAIDYALRRWPEKAAFPMPDPEEEAETYAEALAVCRERMEALLEAERESP